ncbi:hypothetical protein GCM10011374_27150 [Kocuria dechangensis]|uniref:Uncharacterized protein n=1 Tax=Kocuria dechangensis TaxID=1176249 RepID=A0A917LW52_9MICC|nr:hypothetical protein [Kocuria dechangensis]GGG62515.1 hypothetical protein GCM10011374_27150 [Kocuria dechangensis]
MSLGQVPPPEPERLSVDVDVLRALFLSPADWIHRRVEAVEMSPDGVTRRKVSLDVDLAAAAPWPTDASGRLLLPVTIQTKQPLRHFDATCDGDPVPVLTTEDNGALAELLLRGLVPEQLPLEEAQQLAERSIPDLVHAPQLLVEDALDGFWAVCERLRAVVQDLIDRDRLTPEDAAHWEGDFALFTTVADQLARGFLLTFVLPADADGRRVLLKYAMDEEYSAGPLPRVRDRLRHCWMPWVGRVGLHDLASCRSFHLEVTVPAEVRLHEFSALSFEGGRPSGPMGSHRAVDLVLAEDRAVQRWPGAVRGHLALRPTSRFDDAFCEMVLLPARQGITAFASVAVSVITAVLVLVGLVSVFPGNVLAGGWQVPSAATSIVMSVVAVLLSWINRQPEHDIAVRVLRPLRYALNLEAVVMLLLAGAASVPLTPVASAAYWFLLVLAHLVSLVLVARTWHVRRSVDGGRFSARERRRG